MEERYHITVLKKSDFPDAVFNVAVKNGKKTAHVVSITDRYYNELAGGKMSPEELIRKSFLFLLKREPNTSILSEFHLSEIGQYFPEYEEEIKK